MRTRDRATALRIAVPDLRWALLVTLLAALAPGLLRPAVAAQTQSSSDEPIQTLAQGPIPSSIGTNVAWRVVVDEAEPAGQAKDEVRALGFAVAVNEAIRLTNPNTGNVRDLQPGEASYVTEDAEQRRESLTDEAVPYARIALVPADEANDAGGDNLLLVGRPFELRDPRDDVELRAFGGTVGSDPISVSSAWPVLLLVLEGSITILPETGVQLDGGDAVVLAGTLGSYTSGFVATSGEARFVAAAVLSPQETGFSVWPGDGANASFNISACPPGAPVADVGENPGSAGPLCGGDATDAADPVPGAAVELTNTDTGQVFRSQADADGRLSFTDLPAGTYEAAFPDAPAAATRCYTATLDNANGQIYNIAAVPVPLGTGTIMSCAVAFGEPAAS